MSIESVSTAMAAADKIHTDRIQPAAVATKEAVEQVAGAPDHLLGTKAQEAIAELFNALLANVAIAETGPVK